MGREFDSSKLATVSYGLISDLVAALDQVCAAGELHAILSAAGLPFQGDQSRMRLSREQIVRLYKVAAEVTGDEMMGLWSRPIRTGALKQICASMLGASSVEAGVFRMVTFWNLVLDDYQLDLQRDEEAITLSLIPRKSTSVNRFGHMLMLKLTHGLASWLAQQELPVEAVGFAFARPDFHDDYAVLFPAPVVFDASQSFIRFDRQHWQRPITRTRADLPEFLARAPRDWIFTNHREHTLTIRIREMLFVGNFQSTLGDVAAEMNLTPRTLMRRLEAQGASFQSIKDDLRRDIAIVALGEGTAIETLSQDLGFSSASTFHRAFKSWTGQTPAAMQSSLQSE